MLHFLSCGLPSPPISRGSRTTRVCPKTRQFDAVSGYLQADPADCV